MGRLKPRGVSSLEGDQSAGELQQGEVVLFLLRPADKQRAVAVEPRMASLNHPTAGPPTGLACLLFDLFTTRTDVGNEAEIFDLFLDDRCVVAGVEAEVLARLGT